MTKGWKLKVEIVRQFDIEYLSEEKNKYWQRGFLAVCDASYSHMRNGIGVKKRIEKSNNY